MTAAEKRERLISENLGLVHACARRYTGRGVEYDDLYGAGCMGLVKAADGFDSERGIRFSTYAVPAILGEIRRLFRDGGAVKVSRSVKELGLKAAREAAAFSALNGREPHLSELASALGCESADIAEALGAMQQTVSLTVTDDGDRDSQLDLPSDSFDDNLVDILAVRQLVAELEQRDRQLIQLRYFGGKTQCQTAKELGMTQVQVSRREKAIIEKMRDKIVS